MSKTDLQQNITIQKSNYLYLLFDNIIKHFIPILYFLIAIMFYLRTYDSCQIKITLTQVGGTVLILLWSLKFLESPKETFKFYKNNLVIIVPVILFLLSGIFSHLVMSPLKKASGMELIRRVVYMTTVLVIIREINSLEKFNRMFRWLMLALFVATFYGIIQYLDWKYFLPNPEPGLDPFIWRQAFGNRIFSTFGNPNFYGDFLVALGPISLAMFAWKKNPFYLILWIMTTFNAYVTYSKGTWIGFAAGTVFFFIFYIIFFSHFKLKNVRKYLVFGIIGVILLTTWGVYFQLTQRTDSAKFRVNTWLSCWEMINTSPIFGTGIGTFYVTYPSWRRPQIFYIEGKHNTESDHPENEYLEVWYDEGIVGFGIFIWLIITFIFSGIKGLKIFSTPTIITDRKGRQKEVSEDPRAYYMLGLLSGWLGSLTHNTVCVSLRFVSSGTYVWLIAGLIATLVANNPLPKESKEKNVISSTISIFIILIFWAANFLWWKMPNNLVISIVSILFIIGFLLELGKNKKEEVETEIKNNFILRIPQVIFLVICFLTCSVFRGYFIGDMHHNIAIFYSKQANWSEALTNYNIVAKYNPGFIMCHYFMGNVFNDRWILNREFHPEWGDKEDDTPWTKIDLGKKGRIDVERSISKYEDVWNLAPNYVQSHHQAGVVYLKLADYFKNIGNNEKKELYWEKALNEFWKYHKIDPIFPINYQRIASIYIQQGKMEKAEQTYKAHLFTQWLCQTPEDIIKNPKNDDEKKLLEKITLQFKEEKEWGCCDYHNRQHYLVATENWSKRRASEYSDSYLQLANMKYLQKNYDEAIKFYERAIDTHKDNFQAWKNLIIVLQQLKQTEKVNNIIQLYRQKFPNDPNLSQLNNI